MRTSTSRLTGAMAALTMSVVPLVAVAQTPAPEPPKSQVPTLGRPTRPDDPAPLLDFWLYFKGAWHVTWDYPESPLGPADVASGTTVYTQKGPASFSAATTFETSAGTHTVTETFDYQREAKTLTRTVADSRGFRYTQQCTVNGDLGGQFTIRLESAPFMVKGESVRVNSVMRLLSPLNYRTQYTIAIDGGPFTNFGHPWWRKEPSR